MAFLCPVRIRKLRSGRRRVSREEAPLPGRITGSASIDTLVRVGLEKADNRPHPVMVVMHDFTPCVEDELDVRRGHKVSLLYREHDWAYVVTEDHREGFIPFVYCSPLGASVDDFHINTKKITYRSDSIRKERPLPPYQENPAQVGSNDNIRGNPLGQLNKQNSRSMPLISSPDDKGIELKKVEIKSATKEQEIQTLSDSPLIETVQMQLFTKRPCGRYIVLFDFSARAEDDMGVDRGDFVTVLNTDDPDWFWAARTDGQEGFIPSNFLCPAEGQATDFTNIETASVQTTSTTRSRTEERLTKQAVNAKSTSKITKLVCLYDYSAQAPDDLDVKRGDWLHADLTDQPEGDAWLWAYSPTLCRYGYLPRAYAKPPTATHTNHQHPPPVARSAPRDPYISP